MSKTYPCKINHYVIEDSLFHNASTWRGNYFAYYYLRFPLILDKSVKYALVLGCDMLVMCDIRELFSIDLGENFAGITPDYNGARPCMESKIDKKYNIYFDENYFNTGIVLANLESIRKIDYWGEVLNIMNNYELIYADQDILNAIFKDNIQKLSIAYNFMLPLYTTAQTYYTNDESKYYDINYSRKEYDTAEKHPKIYHYVNCKPWVNQESYWQLYGAEAVTGKVKHMLKLWWINALQTPIAKEELQKLHEKLKWNDYMTFSLVTSNKLKSIDDRIQKLEKRTKKRTRKRDIIYGSLFVILLVIILFRI